MADGRQRHFLVMHLPPCHRRQVPRLLEKINHSGHRSDARPARAARLSQPERDDTMPRRSGPRWSRARGASGEYPGPPWWRAAAVRLTRLVSVHREGLCRQRLVATAMIAVEIVPRSASPSNRAAGSWILRLDQPQPATAKDFEATIATLRRLRHAPRQGPSRMTFGLLDHRPSPTPLLDRSVRLHSASPPAV